MVTNHHMYFQPAEVDRTRVKTGKKNAFQYVSRVVDCFDV